MKPETICRVIRTINPDCILVVPSESRGIDCAPDKGTRLRDLKERDVIERDDNSIPVETDSLPRRNTHSRGKSVGPARNPYVCSGAEGIPKSLGRISRTRWVSSVVKNS